MQLLSNIILSNSITLLIATSVMLSYSVTKFFNLSQAAILTVAAYSTYFFIQLDLPIFVAIVVSIACTVILSVLIEISIFGYMRRDSEFIQYNNSFKMLIASIGLYTILQNLISLTFGDDTKSIRIGDVKVGHEVLGAYITNVQIIIIAASLILFVAVLLLLHKTHLGKQIRAISNNPELCKIYGINSKRIIFLVTIFNSVILAIVGILIALDVDMTPTFGFNYFLYGIVAMIISGVGSYKGLFFGALLLTTSQHLAAYYIDTKWMDAVAYIILILFLTWKPLGFSGVRLKKVEV